MAARTFTEEEREAFTDGSIVLIGVKGAGWDPAVVIGGVETDRAGEEYLLTRVPGSEFPETTDSRRYPGGIRTPGAAEGFDYQWATGPGGEPVPTVLFCGACGSVKITVRVNRSTIEGGEVTWFSEPAEDTEAIDDYQLRCASLARHVSHVEPGEYERRLAAVRELGYLMESATWTRERMSLAQHGV